MSNFVFEELTTATWTDFEKLFGVRGACGGCWCMAWRIQKSDFDKNKGAGNKKAMKGLVKQGKVIGILAYEGKEPIGWCSVAPREEFIRLEKSRVLQPIDDKPVWSVSCLFIAKSYRKKGISSQLLEAAVKFAEKKGAKIVEGYPTYPYGDNTPAAFAWTGIPSAFEKAGFEEAGRRSKARPIMRYYIK